jgi:hypothetical protein
LAQLPLVVGEFYLLCADVPFVAGKGTVPSSATTVLVAFMVACLTNLEGARQALLTATSADLRQSLHPFMLLGACVGGSFGLIRSLSVSPARATRIQGHIDLTSNTVDMTGKD